MRNIRDVVAAIKAMASGTIPQGGGRVRRGYSWSKPHSGHRSRTRRLKQAFFQRLDVAAFYSPAEYHKAVANYLASVTVRRRRRTMMP